MIQPQRIGRFLGVDKFGHVQPDVAIERVAPIWQPLVVFVRDTLISRPSVRSVYLRGSIARGLAIEKFSDADFIYFSETDFDTADIELEKAVAATFPFVKALELFRLDRTGFENIRPGQKRPYYQMLLRLSACFSAAMTSPGTFCRSVSARKWSVTSFPCRATLRDCPGCCRKAATAALNKQCGNGFRDE
jgi:predicted nucleotidyltransferase